MTTFAPPAVESDIRDQPAPAPVSLPGEQSSSAEAHVNGLAAQANNAIPEFPSPAKPAPETAGPGSIDGIAASNGLAPEPGLDLPSKPSSHQPSIEAITSKESLPATTALPADMPSSVDGNTPVPSSEVQTSNSDALEARVDMKANEEDKVVANSTAEVPLSEPLEKPVDGPTDAMDVEPTPAPPVAPTTITAAAAIEATEPETAKIESDAAAAIGEPQKIEQAAETSVAPDEAEIKDESMTDAPSKVTREREEDDETGPSAKRARTDESMMDAPEATPVTQTIPEPVADSVADSVAEPVAEPVVEPVAEPIEEPPTATATDTAPETQSQPTPSQAAAEPDSSVPAPQATDASTVPSAAATTPNVLPPQPTPPTDSSPMSELQKKKLVDGLRNMKKAKNAINFLKPVDYVTLNLPNYPNVVKNPMDLSTIENKLKDGKYESVDAYSADWDLMINNAVAFNGQNHLVAQQGMLLRSQLWAQLRRLPKAGEIAPPPAPKKQQSSLAGGIRDTPRRAPAAAAAAAQAAAATTPVSETFAAPNGVPTIRRGSSVGGRPKREIHKPTRDLAYQSAKPIKKKHKAEIDFAKHVLEEMTRPRYEQLSAPFYKPVDPVALAIPNYHSIIKKPMSLSVVKDKLQTNQYETLKEVEADIKLIWANCYKFNGKDHAVSVMASSYEQQFDAELKKKDDWIQAHAPQSAPQSPADDYGSSDEEEDEDDDPETAQLAVLQRQMAELQEKTMALIEQKTKKGAGKKKGGAAGKGAGKGGGGGGAKKRKSGSLGGAKVDKKPKAKAKERPVTVAEKQEISSKIGDLNAEQITKAAELIKDSLRRIGRNDLADKAEDDMEFDIDQIPNDALHQLLKLVRKASAPATVEETHYSKSSSYAPSRPKKNKPMSKSEQEDHIRRLQGQLANFENGVAVGSPTGDDDSSEDDDEESGSESEEE